MLALLLANFHPTRERREEIVAASWEVIENSRVGDTLMSLFDVGRPTLDPDDFEDDSGNDSGND
jgi:hypothetical protein